MESHKEGGLYRGNPSPDDSRLFLDCWGWHLPTMKPRYPGEFYKLRKSLNHAHPASFQLHQWSHWQQPTPTIKFEQTAAAGSR